MGPRNSESGRVAFVLAIIFGITTVGLASALGYTWWYIRRLAPPAVELPAVPTRTTQDTKNISPLLLQYRLDVPGRGEIFPALATSTNSREYWPVAILTITNSGDHPSLQIVRAEVSSWSTPFQQSVIVGPHESTAVRITPELLPAAMNLGEITSARLAITVTDATGATSYAQERNVLIHGAADLYWGKQFANAQLVARWVTPHDPSVLHLVSNAHSYVPRGRMPGYASPKNPAQVPAQVRQQTEAVFRAIKASGFNYLSSDFTFGNFTDLAQRIRFPHETLELDSANCIDISVAFASAIENIDMQPVIVIIPGHAFSAVRLGPGSTDILYLDLTVLPNGTFEQAVARAKHWLGKTPPSQVLMVDIAAARRMGIYPMAAGERQNAQPSQRASKSELPQSQSKESPQLTTQSASQ